MCACPIRCIVNVRGTTRLTSAAIDEVVNRVCDVVIWLMSANAVLSTVLWRRRVRATEARMGCNLFPFVAGTMRTRPLTEALDETTLGDRGHHLHSSDRCRHYCPRSAQSSPIGEVGGSVPDSG